MKEECPEYKTGKSVRVAANGSHFNLSPADRAFLRDLAVIQIISPDLADRYHYPHLKGGAQRRLSRLEVSGLLASNRLYVVGEKPARIYQFASHAIAAAWGGSLPVIGSKRSALHELMTARAYFVLGRPADFRVAVRMSESDIFLCGSRKPDALYTDAATGEIVLVEADSGNYTSAQIRDKAAHWWVLGLLRQIWVQPLGTRVARVPDVAGVRLLKL